MTSLAGVSLCKLLLLDCHLHNSVQPCQPLRCSTVFSTKWSLPISGLASHPCCGFPEHSTGAGSWCRHYPQLVSSLCCANVHVKSSVVHIKSPEWRLLMRECSSGGLGACCSQSHFCPHLANSTLPRFPYFQHKPSLSRKQSMAIKVTKPIYTLIWIYAHL